MRDFAPDGFDVDEAVAELLEGSGGLRFPQAISPETVANVRARVMELSELEAPKVTHFQETGGDQDLLHKQRRVWNLLAKGDVFSEMATLPAVMKLMRTFLGDEFIMGSICASRLLPGSPGQEPHIDYPYWDFHKPKSFPVHTNATFPLNAQATIVLDPFTEESGATAFMPGSQRQMRYPSSEDNFFDTCARMTGDPGDVFVFFGAAWHCAMPNNSDHDRSAILIEYLPKFVKPVEDMLSHLDDDFLGRADPLLRQLLGFDYPYPQNFEASPAVSAEGRGGTEQHAN